MASSLPTSSTIWWRCMVGMRWATGSTSTVSTTIHRLSRAWVFCARRLGLGRKLNGCTCIRLVRLSRQDICRRGKNSNLENVERNGRIQIGRKLSLLKIQILALKNLPGIKPKEIASHEVDRARVATASSKLTRSLLQLRRLDRSCSDSPERGVGANGRDNQKARRLRSRTVELEHEI